MKVENKKNHQYIEIVTIPPCKDVTIDRKNVGIELDERRVLEILSKVYEKVCVTIIQTPEDLQNLVDKKPDLVFYGIKYFEFGEEKIWLSDHLRDYDICYITSNKEALNNEYDKTKAKKIVREENIITADFFTTQPSEHSTIISLNIKFPLFLKPITGGDSIGINADSIVFDFEQYQAKVLDIYTHQGSRTLVEKYLSGKEYSVSILENIKGNTLRVLPIEIIAGKNKNGYRLLDYDAKLSNKEDVIAVKDAKLHQALCDIALSSFRVLGGKTMGRVDIMADGKGVLHFIEANFMPGLSQGYFYRSFMLNESIGYEGMILEIADAGLNATHPLHLNGGCVHQSKLNSLNNPLFRA